MVTGVTTFEPRSTAGTCKGERAMAVAVIYPDTNQGKRSETSEKISELGGSSRYVNMARAVPRHALLAEHLLQVD